MAGAAAAVLHGLADTVGHEPGSLVRHTEHALDLLATDALLAGAHQVGGLEPLVERHLAVLEHGANGHAELAAAVLALPQARTVRGALELVVLANRAAMRAHRAIRPAQSFKMLAGLVGVLIVREVEDGFGHWNSRCEALEPSAASAAISSGLA